MVIIMMKIVAASGNQGKIREFKEILDGFEIASARDMGIAVEIEENGASFEENCLIKARAISKLCRLPVLADDSGLCVDALGGRPGIYSARYAGENATDLQRMEKLLAELDGAADRSAKFVSVTALVMPDGTELTARGEVHGRILSEISGDGGFGYDPIFYSDELGKSFGTASEEEKNSVSHRGRALIRLRKELLDYMKKIEN